MLHINWGIVDISLTYASGYIHNTYISWLAGDWLVTGWRLAGGWLAAGWRLAGGYPPILALHTPPPRTPPVSTYFSQIMGKDTRWE